MSKETNYNTIALSTIQHFSKPVKEEAGALQLYKNTEVKKITPSELAQAIEQGYSFHPGIPNFKAGGYSFRDDKIAFQNIFAVDIDHHSYEVEELLAKCPATPNVIYTTFSSTPENKRYRVVWFANQTLKSKTTIIKVNQFLTAAFLEGLADDVLAFSDLSAINPARLFYGGSAVVYLNEDARLSLDDVFQNDEQMNQAIECWERAERETLGHGARIRGIRKLSDYVTEADWTLFLTLEKQKTTEAYHGIKRIATKLEKEGLMIQGDKLLKSVAQRRNSKGKVKEPKRKCQAGERSTYRQQLEDVFARLTAYRVTETRYLAYQEAIQCLNKLPLHELFNQPLDRHCLSLLREEEHPSALFFETRTGNIVYYDYATKETLNTVNLLSEMMTIEYGTTKAQNIETLLEKLNLKMWSPYKVKAVEEIMRGRDLFLDLIQSEQPHEAKTLLAYGVGHTYVGICNLLSRYLPNEPLMTDESIVVYRSLQDLHAELNTGFYADVSKMQIKGYDTFVRKMNYLCALGFLIKRSSQDATPAIKAGLKEHKKKWLEKGLDEKDYKEPNLYQFVPITPETLAKAVEQKQFLDQQGITLRTIRQKHLSVVSEALAKVSYQTPKPAYNKNEQKFIDLCVKQAHRLLAQQDYFTEEQLLSRMLQSDSWYNGTIKTTPAEVELDPVDKETNTRIERRHAKLGMKRKLKTFKDLQAPILTKANCQRLKVSEAPASIRSNTSVHHNSYIYLSNESF